MHDQCQNSLVSEHGLGSEGAREVDFELSLRVTDQDMLNKEALQKHDSWEWMALAGHRLVSIFKG